ncbi:MAG: hypothetical protein KatS3mg076_2260 [Candidatus Binatia bacterium]|nr:MAG: hypothetical protein KatS3mg076_2260 [Candidatus Binatia bacterium]
MRFVVTGEWTRNDLLRGIVWCFLLYTAFLWISNAAMFFSRMSLDPASVVAYYRGDETRFLPPRSVRGMLEVLHFHAFAAGILLLTLTHLLLFVPLSVRTKVAGIALAFGSAFLDEASGWGVRFLHPGFAYLKIASFLALQGVLLWLGVLVARALLRREPSAYPKPPGPPRPLT